MCVIVPESGCGPKRAKPKSPILAVRSLERSTFALKGQIVIIKAELNRFKEC